jgi:hypothetical protein
VAFSLALIRPVVALLPVTSKIPRLDQIRLDGGVLLFTMLVSIGCGLVFGILPAIRASRGDLAPALKSGGRGSSPARHEGRWNDSLVAAEVAVSLLLLVCGGLFTRAFLQLVHTDPGFRPAHAVALQLAIPPYRYPVPAKPSEDGARRQLYDRLQAAAQSLAEVEHAAISRRLPFRQFWDPEGISIEGRPPLPEGAWAVAEDQQGARMADSRRNVVPDGLARLFPSSRRFAAARPIVGLARPAGCSHGGGDQPGRNAQILPQ